VARAGNLIGGRYQLVDEIGQGAMGCVWSATHLALGRTFAVKFLKPYDLDRARSEERFLREARLAAGISHRFVVDIVDFGTSDEGTPYLVMEHLRGEGLDARLARDPPLTVRELVRLIGEVLLGLEAVHAAGVVHRDVKPENILLTREADQIVPKLVDFGVSREEPSATLPGRPTPLTGFGTAMGTPWYMSPEQANGRLLVDRRSDIFSVGVVLYEALTGVTPFDGPTLDAVLAAVAAGAHIPLQVMRGDLDPALCAVVDTALERDPERRHQRAEMMASGLMAVMPSLPEDQVCQRAPVMVSLVPPSVRRSATAIVTGASTGSPRSPKSALRAQSRRYATAVGLLMLAGVLIGQTARGWSGRVPSARVPSARLPSPPAAPALSHERLPALTAVTPVPVPDPQAVLGLSPVPAPPAPRPRPPRRSKPVETAAAPDFFRTPGF
jgi:serine/threonine protein kinase